MLGSGFFLLCMFNMDFDRASYAIILFEFSSPRDWGSVGTFGDKFLKKGTSFPGACFVVLGICFKPARGTCGFFASFLM